MKKNLIVIIMMAALTGLAGGCSVADKGQADKQAEVAAENKAPAPGAKPVTPTNQTEAVKSGALPAAIAEIVKYQYTEKYTSPAYGFSFKYPKDFSTSELPSDVGDVILVQQVAKNIGIQIMISPFDGGDIDVTADYIKAEIPDMKISDQQEVLIGPNRKGLAFMSNNEAFGGASREVWFVFNNNLYQISTYAEFDKFLQGLFGTWEFK